MPTHSGLAHIHGDHGVFSRNHRPNHKSLQTVLFLFKVYQFAALRLGYTTTKGNGGSEVTPSTPACGPK